MRHFGDWRLPPGQSGSDALGVIFSLKTETLIIACNSLGLMA